MPRESGNSRRVITVGPYPNAKSPVASSQRTAQGLTLPLTGDTRSLPPRHTRSRHPSTPAAGNFTERNNMARASKACSNPQCPNLQPCPTHEKKPWEGSTRRTKTISGWEQQRRARLVIAKHHGICHICGDTGADEADHVIPLQQGGPDTIENMRPIHGSPCHQEKTQREAQLGRATHRA